MGDYQVVYAWRNKQGNIIKLVQEFSPRPMVLADDVGIKLENSPPAAVRLTIDIAIPEF